MNYINYKLQKLYIYIYHMTNNLVKKKKNKNTYKSKYFLRYNFSFIKYKI